MTDSKPDPFSRAEIDRRGHRIEWNHGWEYTSTWVFARDYPDGWPGRDTPPEGVGWEKNTDTRDGGYEVIDGASGQMWVSYWRRKR